MKKLLITTALVAGLAAAPAVVAQDGRALFQSNGCTACHQATAEGVGPANKRIADGYRGKEAQLKAFLKGNAPAIIDPAKFAIMQANLASTKAMNDAQLDALVKYIMGH